MATDYTETPWSRRRQANVRADQMKVEHVLAFADILRDKGFPLGEYVTANLDHNTRHFIGLFCSVTEEGESGGY